MLNFNPALQVYLHLGMEQWSWNAGGVLGKNLHLECGWSPWKEFTLVPECLNSPPFDILTDGIISTVSERDRPVLNRDIYKIMFWRKLIIILFKYTYIYVYIYAYSRSEIGSTTLS